MQLSVVELSRQHLGKGRMEDMPKPLPTYFSEVDLSHICLLGTVAITFLLISPTPH